MNTISTARDTRACSIRVEGWHNRRRDRGMLLCQTLGTLKSFVDAATQPLRRVSVPPYRQCQTCSLPPIVKAAGREPSLFSGFSRQTSAEPQKVRERA